MTYKKLLNHTVWIYPISLRIWVFFLADLHNYFTLPSFLHFLQATRCYNLINQSLCCVWCHEIGKVLGQRTVTPVICHFSSSLGWRGPVSHSRYTPPAITLSCNVPQGSNKSAKSRDRGLSPANIQTTAPAWSGKDIFVFLAIEWTSLTPEKKLTKISTYFSGG